MMRKIVTLMAAIFFAAGVLFLGCKKDAFGNVDTLSFSGLQQTGQLFDAATADTKVRNLELANSPENAVVALFFDENGDFVTKQAFDKNPETNWNTQFTDLATFKKWTNESTATSEYADVLSETEGKAVWAYDYYANSHIKRAAKNALSGQNGSNQNSVVAGKVTDFLRGDVIARYRALSNSSLNGHAACIVDSYLSSTSMTTLMSNTYEMSARGYFTSKSEEVKYQKLSVDWNVTDTRYRLRPKNLTTTQKNTVAAFLSQQDPDGYSISASKRFKCTTAFCNGTGPGSVNNSLNVCCGAQWANGSSWYCSLLVWQAYKYAADIDIDSDGGAWVFPSDVLGSSQFTKDTF